MCELSIEIKNYENPKSAWGYSSLCSACVDKIQLKRSEGYLLFENNINLNIEVLDMPKATSCDRCGYSTESVLPKHESEPSTDELQYDFTAYPIFQLESDHALKAEDKPILPRKDEYMVTMSHSTEVGVIETLIQCVAQKIRCEYIYHDDLKHLVRFETQKDLETIAES